MRNAVQTQLDGVQKGLHTLQELEKIVHEVKTSMSDVDSLYQDCAELSDVVKPIREVNRKHQQVQPRPHLTCHTPTCGLYCCVLQLKTTTNHIHNIFNVPTVVKETQDLIQENRLLEAHRK